MSIHRAIRAEPPVESNIVSAMARTEGLVHHPGSCDTNTEATSSLATNVAMNQFSLIPLHPASKRTKLVAKQFPIVMGRTNLAAWWWRSCPCQHYCRLHCRPVAQNIRSLSKVMIQVDTAGRVHVVGKNSHLITITPDRGDNILQLNDVISIGRRDREPWMRFQVVQKPEGNAPVVSCARRRSGISTIDKAPESQEWVATLPHLPPSAQVPSSTLRNVPTKDNNRPVGPAVSNRKVILNLPRNLDASTTPPEWITTNTRQRNSDRTNSIGRGLIRSSRNSPPVERATEFQHSHRHPSGTTNLARTANASYPTSNHHLPSTRKRRRQSLESLGVTPRPKRSAYKGNLQGSSGDKNSVGTGATPNGDNSIRDHLHVHLVFQEYQTSANLLQDNELKRKAKSLIHQHGPMDRDVIQDVSPHPHENPVPHGMGMATSSAPIRENATAGLLSIADPNAQDKAPTPRGSPLPTLPSVYSNVNQSTRRSLFMPSSEELSVPVLAKDIIDKESSQGFATSKETWNNVDAEYEASMLSLPQCASSNLEEGQRTIPIESSNGDILPASKNHDELLDDESVSSPPSCDPIMDLKPWQDMIQHEEEKGNSKSFRHALASLIVAKNKDRLGPEGGKRGLLWLPPLLGQDFKMKRDGRL